MTGLFREKIVWIFLVGFVVGFGGFFCLFLSKNSPEKQEVYSSFRHQYHILCKIVKCQYLTARKHVQRSLFGSGERSAFTGLFLNEAAFLSFIRNMPVVRLIVLRMLLVPVEQLSHPTSEYSNCSLKQLLTSSTEVEVSLLLVLWQIDIYRIDLKKHVVNQESMYLQMDKHISSK